MTLDIALIKDSSPWLLKAAADSFQSDCPIASSKAVMAESKYCKSWLPYKQFGLLITDYGLNYSAYVLTRQGVYIVWVVMFDCKY
ncbi:MAG: hypothetical protein UU65_C0006G0034 [candidate division CPR2 bacterium GW2011_GWC1_41_48]|uniref:Uncharacterized protein n=1 Tax=candidate division CPR2 bacterium GW2011_GWC1_41_48 TaxID=1618344 RepID=A0A0G0W6S4_UNCC2|nr:MAG: hypothetical protein UT47_C0007G0002 [candidate division CPR2 bacterium GW2011_GWC2_39_35]KKR28749.1 MAG: hypothetical protein UT60_C0013G0016 [candidate division CPR2 bacterium GW2011_GWD2_39_7]KKS08664.1 MAG: hypothetical protein UU65_C0006G0034 [candidate division CPR2 bacterium GW2011_GWC1_41_48]